MHELTASGGKVKATNAENKPIRVAGSGVIFDIRRYSIHDGPGIRTSVFLKGCPLRCQWCHNPEGLAPALEIAVRSNMCIDDCRICIDACPRSAIARNNGGVGIQNDICLRCGTCASACPAEVIQRLGRVITVDDAIAEILKDRVFYDESGGGATFSGGEPLMQPEFLLELLVRCREQRIHTAVDTSGFASPGTLARIAELTDLFLYDIKLIDERRHIEFTKCSNEIILKNLRELVRQGHPVNYRVPLIPGVNDSDDDQEQIAAFLEGLKGPQTVALLPYHLGGRNKYRKLGREDEMGATEPLSNDRIESIKTIFKSRGFDVSIGE